MQQQEIDALECVEIEPPLEADAVVIWLHGLGADGHDFESIVPQLELGNEHRVRFVFPHAPVRPVTLNGGYPMRAWYDLEGVGGKVPEDHHGIDVSHAQVMALLEREFLRGIAPSRMILAGFSQGGAMALWSGLTGSYPVAGVLAMSTYVLQPEQFHRTLAAHATQTPVMMMHGIADNVVPFDLGWQSYQHLKAWGLDVSWAEYEVDHSVCWDEIRAVSRWIKERFDA